MLDDTAASRKVRKYCEEKLRPYYGVQYVPASGSFAPSVRFKSSSMPSVWGNDLWNFLERLREKIEDLASAPLTWFENEGFQPIYNPKLHKELDLLRGDLIRSLKEECGLGAVQIHIYVGRAWSGFHGNYEMAAGEPDRTLKIFPIYCTREALEQLPGEELKAAFAHEFGHILIMLKNKKVSFRRSFHREHACDIFAISHTSKDAMVRLRIRIHCDIAKIFKREKPTLDYDEVKHYIKTLKDNCRLIRAIFSIK